MRKKYCIVIAIILISLVMVAGCGGDKTPAPAAPEEPTPAQEKPAAPEPEPVPEPEPEPEPIPEPEPEPEPVTAPEPEPEPTPPPEPEPEPEPTPEPEEIEMTITSSAFQYGEAIPEKYSCEGQDVSPELTWGGVPEGTQSLALILDDPDAPGGTFNHWVIYNIPVGTLELAEAISKTSELSDGTMQGRNSFGSTGYGGPCPPPGLAHHYYFTIYALDITLDLGAGASKTQVLAAMEGHILAQAETMGTYQR